MPWFLLLLLGLGAAAARKRYAQRRGDELQVLRGQCLALLGRFDVAPLVDEDGTPDPTKAATVFIRDYARYLERSLGKVKWIHFKSDTRKFNIGVVFKRNMSLSQTAKPLRSGIAQLDFFASCETVPNRHIPYQDFAGMAVQWDEWPER